MLLRIEYLTSWHTLEDFDERICKVEKSIQPHNRIDESSKSVPSSRGKQTSHLKQDREFGKKNDWAVSYLIGVDQLRQLALFFLGCKNSRAAKREIPSTRIQSLLM